MGRSSARIRSGLISKAGNHDPLALATTELVRMPAPEVSSGAITALRVYSSSLPARPIGRPNGGSA